MRQQFNPENFNVWLDYYSSQANQVGYGMTGFKGFPYHRGAGIGSFFRSLFRMAVPLIKSAATNVGKQALASGANIATDVLQGRPLIQSLEEHGKEGASNLIKKASSAIQKGRGLGIRPTSIKETKQDVFSVKTRKRRKNVTS
jgi:hypothetical protein